MCVYSMVADHFNDRWKGYIQQSNPGLGTGTITFPDLSKGMTPTITQISREEFDKLKSEVELLKGLLIRAKKYDIDNNEPDCEMVEKVDMLKRIAELVGVDLKEVL